MTDISQKSSDLASKLRAVRKSVDDDFRRHPFISGELRHKLLSVLDEQAESIEQAQKDYPDLLAQDSLGDEIATLLASKVGPLLSP